MRQKIIAGNHQRCLWKHILILFAAWFTFSTAYVIVIKANPSANMINNKVRIGVLAKRGSEQCLEKWGSTADYLTTQLPGYSFSVIPLGFDQIHKAVDHKEIEFILANSSIYVNLEVRFGVRRIATLNNLHADGTTQKVFAGVIFCRADRQDIRNVQDMKNKDVMAVDEQSLGGWLMEWREMKELGIKPHRDFATLQFAGTHDAVIHAVSNGDVDIGCVRTDTLERMALEGTIKLNDFKLVMLHKDCSGEVHFLHSTRHYPEWPFAKSPHTTDELAREVAIALMRMPANCFAAQAAKCAGWIIPQNYQPVHECLMELRFPPYENYGKITFRDVLRLYWPWILCIFFLITLIFLSVIYAFRLKTKLKQSILAKEERERARAFMQTVIDGFPEGLMVIDLDYNVMMMNRNIHKKVKNHDLSTSTLKCHQLIFGREIPCDSDDLSCALKRVIECKSPVTVEHIYRDSQANETFCEVIAAPIFDENEGILMIVETMRDITKRKQDEKMRERLMLAIEQAAEAIVITNTEATIKYVNPAFEQITGYTREEAVGQNPRILKSGKHNEEYYRTMWSTLTRGETWKGRFVNKKKDGILYIEDATISPVIDALGKTINYVAVKRDITHETELEEQLRQAQKMEAIGTLAGGIAHDFNNILCVIMGYTEFARTVMEPQSQASECLTQVYQASIRAKELVHQILAFSRKTEPQFISFVLDPLIKEVLKLLRSSIPSTIEIRSDITEKITLINGDPIQIHQVLMNLCTNASYAMREHGGVLDIILHHETIESKQIIPFWGEIEAGDYAKLVIRDSGCGISSKHLRKIFDPFFTTKPTSEGTGMGLSVVHGIIKNHNGVIQVSSQIGEGTTFEILLPLVHKQLETETTDEVQQFVSGKGERVLFVDDEEQIMLLNTKRLNLFGYEVIGVTNSTKAWQMFKDNPGSFDIVITDQTMPKLTGKELAGKILEIRPEMPIILCSGFSDQTSESEAKKIGIMEFLNKPVSAVKIAETINQCMAHNKRE